MLHQLFDSYVGLHQDRLQRLGFDLTVHRHTRMQAGFCIMPVRARLPHKLETQPLEGATNLLARKIARQLHAG